MGFGWLFGFFRFMSMREVDVHEAINGFMRLREFIASKNPDAAQKIAKSI